MILLQRLMKIRVDEEYLVMNGFQTAIAELK